MPKIFNPGSRHKDYLKWLPVWRTLRCIMEGERRIKEEDVMFDFLPKLEGQDTPNEEGIILCKYRDYLKRATFTNYTARTVDGLVGAIMRKEPVVKWPKERQFLLEQIGVDLSSLEELINDTLYESVGIGRYCHLVDAAPNDDGDVNAYVAVYHGEAITDWEYGRVAGRKRVVRVHLMEESDVENEQGEKLIQYRILRLGEPEPVTEREQRMSRGAFLEMAGLSIEDFDAGPVYFQEVWQEVPQNKSDRKRGAASSYVRLSVVAPRTLGGRLWREIPCVLFNSTKLGARTQKPLMDDIARINIGHYRNAADLEHGLHFSGLPQPWVAGFKYKAGITIGSSHAWVSEDPNAKAGYLEVQGDFAALNTEMMRKEKRMAVMGGRLLEEPANAGDQEAPGTVKMRNAGEHSVMARVSRMNSLGMTQTMRFLHEFYTGVKADPKAIECMLNRDFGTETLSPQMLQALMLSVMNGVMSWDTFVYNAKRGELYPDGWEQKEEDASIRRGTPGRSLDQLLDPVMGNDGPADVDNAVKPKKPAK